MNSASLNGFPTMSAFPHKISSIVVSVGILASFLIYASWLLISQPMVSPNSERPYNVDHSKKYVSPISLSKQSTIETPHGDNVYVKHRNPSIESDLLVPSSPSDSSIVSTTTKAAHEQESHPIFTSGITKDHLFTDSDSTLNGSEKTLPDENYSNSKTENAPASSLLAESASKTSSDDSGSALKSSENVLTSSLLAESKSKTSSDDSGCDLYHGNWYYDSTGPLYTNNTCPVLTQMQNCQGNGRPDKEYENYRWKPSQCDLPRFDPKNFLELMRGKTIALIGDSVARNQMESLLCILWQVEVPKNRGNRRMQRWYFRSTSVMIVRIWSSWLVHQTSEPFDFAPEGVVKLHLDAPDENFMEFLPTFDVIVLSSGHWFAKQSVYVLNEEIVGGQLWWPDKSRPQKINSIDAFGVSVETIISSIATHPNYTGIAIVRSYSPDHYEGGAWNTGGSCTGKDRPVKDGELVQSEYTNVMHEKQVLGFNQGIKKQTNKAKLRLMDITNAFEYRHDGHPGPYRSPDPNKITKRGPDGKPPPQDCLHWCMPGPVDTWNEIVLEIIQREYS